MPPFRKPIEKDVNDRRGVKGERLAEQQSADHCNTQRTPQFGSKASSEGQRDTGEQRRHGGHHDGAEAQQTGVIDGVRRVLPMLALAFQREIDHHDAVLLHDADQQNNADDGDDAQILTEDHERQERAHAG